MIYCTFNLLNMFQGTYMPIIRSSRLYLCYYHIWCVTPWLLVVGICGNNTSIVSSSWWWAYKCPKHVEQITSAINHSVVSSWFSSLRINKIQLCFDRYWFNFCSLKKLFSVCGSVFNCVTPLKNPLIDYLIGWLIDWLTETMVCSWSDSKNDLLWSIVLLVSKITPQIALYFKWISNIEYFGNCPCKMKP